MLLVRTVWGKYMSCATARLVGGWRWTTRFRWSAPLGVATGFTPTGGRWSVLAIGHRQRRRMLFVSSPIGTAWPPVAYPRVYNWAIEGPRNRPKPIPRWDVHFGVLKMTERTPQPLVSPLGPNWVGTDSAV